MAKFWGKNLNVDNQWFEIKSQNGEAEVLLYDVIGWPFIDAEMFVRELNHIDADIITLRINSPGGDVFDGRAIFNALKSHPAKINTVIEGIAASMASIIALSGDTVTMSEGAFYMIHNPWVLMLGDSKELRKEADLLDKIGGELAKTYINKTGLTPSKIKQLMDDETWFTGEEAKSSGFIDQVDGETKKSAEFNAGVFNNTPDELSVITAKKPVTERELERLLTRDAGMSRSQARDIINSGYRLPTRDAGEEQALQRLIQVTKSMAT